ncbi:NlpC/P60 family protein [Ileibacterium valens]|uniref:NlpC/P60 family protein n=3 Tax=Ileibacterium valens TaxID=1862668 RepID=UPI00259BE80F|nr:NlpC/P60 family protein [Ileibacterium valens]
MKKSIVAAAVIAATGFSTAAAAEVFAEDAVIAVSGDEQTTQETSSTPFINDNEKAQTAEQDLSALPSEGSQVQDVVSTNSGPAEDQTITDLPSGNNKNETNLKDENEENKSEGSDQTDEVKENENVLLKNEESNLDDKTSIITELVVTETPKVQLNGWSSDKLSYFENGQALIGVKTVDGKLYNFGLDGKIIYGQNKVGEEAGRELWVCADKQTGVLFTGLTHLKKEYNPQGEKTVYYDKNGYMHFGQLTLDNKNYFFDQKTGAMAVNKIVAVTDDKSYYYGKDGTMQYGQHQVNNDWYCFDNQTGVMKTGIVNLDKSYQPDDPKVVYYNTSKSGKTPYGAMVYGMANVGKDLYYFKDGSGKMLTNGIAEVTVDGTKGKIYLGSDGKAITGEKETGPNQWRYFDKTTHLMVTGFKDLDKIKDKTDQNKTVYYDTKTGIMAYGQRQIGNDWYCFERGSGRMITGFFYLDKNYQPDDPKLVYYSPKQENRGAMLYGLQEINGKKYYLMPGSGTKAVNKLVDVTGGKIYLDGNGVMVTGEKETGPNQWRFFDYNTGLMKTGFHDLKKTADKTDRDKTVYYDTKTGIMAYGQRQIGNDWYCFERGSGRMITGFFYLDKNYQPDDPKLVYYSPKQENRGAMLYGLQEINGKKYYLMPGSGTKAVNKLVDVTGGKIYLDGNGVMVTGEKETGPNQWRFFDYNTGLMKTGFHDLKKTADKTDRDKTVYYDTKTGIMAYGQRQIGNDWYCFERGSGRMITGKFYLDKNYQPNDPKWVYYETTGKPGSGLGKMLYGEIERDSKVFYAAPGSGKLKNKYARVEKDGFAVYNQNGDRAVNTQFEYQGGWYFMDRNGQVAKNKLVKLTKDLEPQGEKTVYYGSDGKMVYGTRKIDNNWKYFHPGSGAMAVNEFVNIKKAYNSIHNEDQNYVFDKNGNLVYQAEYEINGSKFKIDPATGKAKQISTRPSWCKIVNGQVIFDPPGYPTLYAGANTKLGKLLLSASEHWGAQFSSGGRDNDKYLDCIGFVMRTFNKAFDLHMNAANVHEFVTQKGYAYMLPSVSSLVPGDLVVYCGTWTPVTTRFTHSSIYVGNGMIMYMAQGGCQIGSMYDIAYHYGGPAPRYPMRLPV